MPGSFLCRITMMVPPVPHVGEVVRASTLFGAVVINPGSITPDIRNRFTCCPTLCYEAAARSTKDTLPMLMQQTLHALCMCLLY